MLRISIKTKLIAVIAVLVLGFALFDVAYYPARWRAASAPRPN